jgi:hypothetical protein
VAWDVEVTGEFKAWWGELTEAERISVERSVLLLGGDKTGDDRWYERNVPLADRLYDNYLAGIKEEDDAKDDKVQ